MAPRNEDKAMDGLLRRSLARDAARGSGCPEPDALAAYSERSLEADEVARYEAHFSTCPRCRAQLAGIFRAQAFTEVPVAAEMRAQPAAPVAIGVRAPAALAASAHAKPAKSPRAWAMNWRWLAPVAAALVLVAVFKWQRAFRLAHAPLPETQIAMSRSESAPKPLADRPSESLDAVQPTAPQPATKAGTEARYETKAGAKEESRPAKKAPLVAAEHAPAATPRLQSKTRESLGAAYSRYEQADNLRKSSEGLSTALEKPSRDGAAPSSTESAVVKDERETTTGAPSAAPPMANPAPPAAPAQRPSASEVAATSSQVTVQAAPSDVEANAKKQTPSTTRGLATGAFGGAQSTVRGAHNGMAPVVQSQAPNVQYRVAGVGRIERSDDSGATWQGQRVKAAAQILAGAAPSENVCWLVGGSGTVLLTTDGKSWKKIAPPAEVDLVAVSAADASNATVTAADGRNFRTTDGGQTWQLAK